MEVVLALPVVGIATTLFYIINRGMSIPKHVSK